MAGLFLDSGDGNAFVEVISPGPGIADVENSDNALRARQYPSYDTHTPGKSTHCQFDGSCSILDISFLPERRTSHVVRVQEIQELKHYVAKTNCVQFFFIHQRNSYSPLAITHELFETLLYEKRVPPSFKDYILYMGEREREVEIAPPTLRRTPPGSPTLDGDVHALECMYGLRFIDLNGRGNLHQPTSRWSLRQTAVYCRPRPSTNEGTWILVTPSSLAKHRLTELFNDQARNSPSNPFTIHVLLLENAIANWRPYLVDLAAETDQHAAQLLGASRDDEGPISMADCGERQELMLLDEKLLNAELVIKATTSTVKYLLKFYESTLKLKVEQQAVNDDSITFAFVNQLQELDLNSMRVEALRARLQGITNSVSSFLDLNSGFALQNLARESRKENEEMRHLSERMHELTKKSTQDAAAVKVLTIVTLIYLPATVVSNFFSTSFVDSHTTPGGSSHIVVSNEWWIFVAAAVPLTLLTLYIWYVWMRIQAYGKYPCWWQRGRNALRSGLGRLPEEKV
jgi:Mg2+ and Co2+ transporter CorA